jgi:hypothetical protein
VEVYNEFDSEWRRVESCENRLAIYCEGFCKGVLEALPIAKLKIIGKEGKLNRECVVRRYGEESDAILGGK